VWNGTDGPLRFKGCDSGSAGKKKEEGILTDLLPLFDPSPQVFQTR